MDSLIYFFVAFVDLSNAMAPYILFGLLFAGFLHELVPDTLVTRHLGSNSIGSVVKSALFGIPLPVCSCGVVPLAASIKKSGAGNGATLTFLISTPITGVDSILATYGMFGWAFTLYRVFTSMVIAIVAGILTNIYSPEKKSSSIKFSTAPAAAHLVSVNNFSVSSVTASTQNAGSDSCENTTDKKRGFSLTASLRYAFVTLPKEIAKPLFWGLVLGAAITAAMPQNLSSLLIEYGWLSYIIAIAIALPMYVCATASLPIAAGLMLAGVSPGAAFVFLSAGPATNTVTIGVVKKMLGYKALGIYLGTIIFGSVVFGIGLDILFNNKGIDILEMIHLHEEAGTFEILSSVVMWIMILYYMSKPLLEKVRSRD